MELIRPEIQQVVELLADTPMRISKETEGVVHSLLHNSSMESEWSVNDILAHLRACADVWEGSINKMISQDHPTLRRVSPCTWIRKKDYLQLAFESNLEALASQRSQLLATLSTLSLDEWSRGATFTGTVDGSDVL
jgi:hypothetical protein